MSTAKQHCSVQITREKNELVDKAGLINRTAPCAGGFRVYRKALTCEGTLGLSEGKAEGFSVLA